MLKYECIAYANSAQAKIWKNDRITFDELCERLKNTIRTSETVEKYQNFDKPKRDAIKNTGGFFGGLLKDGRRKADCVESRSMLNYDVDKAEMTLIEKYKRTCRFTACFYSTHSHTPETPRERIILPLTRDVTPDEYIAISRYLAYELGIDHFDECSYKINQFMYWPSGW